MKPMKTTKSTLQLQSPIIITKEQAHKLLAESNNIVNVNFIKKDGSLRSMNCRRRVLKYLHGGKNTTTHMFNIINVFDMIKKEYRKINTDNLLSLTMNKIQYKVQI